MKTMSYEIISFLIVPTNVLVPTNVITIITLLKLSKNTITKCLLSKMLV